MADAGGSRARWPRPRIVQGGGTFVVAPDRTIAFALWVGTAIALAVGVADASSDRGALFAFGFALIGSLLAVMASRSCIQADVDGVTVTSLTATRTFRWDRGLRIEVTARRVRRPASLEVGPPGEEVPIDARWLGPPSNLPAVAEALARFAQDCGHPRPTVVLPRSDEPDEA